MVQKYFVFFKIRRWLLHWVFILPVPLLQAATETDDDKRAYAGESNIHLFHQTILNAKKCSQFSSTEVIWLAFDYMLIWVTCIWLYIVFINIVVKGHTSCFLDLDIFNPHSLMLLFPLCACSVGIGDHAPANPSGFSD